MSSPPYFQQVCAACPNQHVCMCGMPLSARVYVRHAPISPCGLASYGECTYMVIDAWHPCLNHLSDAWHPCLNHLSVAWHPCLNHLSDAWHPCLNHLSDAWHSCMNHLSDTWHPCLNHLSDAWHPCLNHLNDAWHPCLNHLISWSPKAEAEQRPFLGSGSGSRNPMPYSLLPAVVGFTLGFTLGFTWVSGLGSLPALPCLFVIGPGLLTVCHGA